MSAPQPLPSAKTIAQQLNRAAEYLTICGEDMPARAYQRAARAIETLGDDLPELTPEALTRIRGIGAGIATEIASLRQQPQLPRLVSLEAHIPLGVQHMLRVQGLGAKKVRQLWDAGIDSLTKLLAAAEDGSLQQLKGFGAKSSARITNAARFALDSLSSLRLDQAERLATELSIALAPHLAGAPLQVTGELRRMCEVVQGLECITTHAEPLALLERLSRQLTSMLPEAEDIALHDTRIPSLRFAIQQHPITLHACQPSALPCALAATTGSPEHWQALVTRAHARGWQLSPQGLQDAQGTMLPLADEAALYQQLGLPYLPPECRDGATSISLEGSEGSALVSLEDMRGLVHNHSQWSDGAHSLETMAHEAQARGFAYLAMADHSRSSAIAHGLSEAQVQAQAKAIHALNTQLQGFRVLHGIEVDILQDGSLDYADTLLASLDYTVVSVHQHFNLSEAEQTARIIAAVSHPYADILGHATGRILLRRPSYAVDIAAVIEACAAHGTILELNASPYRLDISWQWLRYALECGCDIAINPDAHSAAGYDVLRYGVMQARKAGVPASRVINTADNAEAFLARLPKRAKRLADMS